LLKNFKDLTLILSMVNQQAEFKTQCIMAPTSLMRKRKAGF